MSKTVVKGDLGRTRVIFECALKGYTVSLPMTENSKYDLIIERNGKLERIQVKSTTSDGEVVTVRCRSHNKWTTHKYTSTDIDAIICYDDATEQTYYIPASRLGEGMTSLRLRLVEGKNTQKCLINWAKDFIEW